MFFILSILLLAFIGIGYFCWRQFVRASYLTWPLFYQMLAKWALITIICGGYSFLLGAMVSGFRFIPMIAAMAITAVVLAFIESRGQMGEIKARFPLLKSAMTYGTRFRIFWAYITLIDILIAFMGSAFNISQQWVITLLVFPQMTEGLIGQVVSKLFKLIGFNIERLSRTPPILENSDQTPEWINQLGVFGVSLTTAAIHVIILGVIVLLIWGGLSAFYALRQKKIS